MDMFQSLANIATVANVVILLPGAVLGLVQWNRTCKNRQAEFCRELISYMRVGTVRKLVSIVEYHPHWYDRETFHGSEYEEFIDEALSRVAYFCYLYRTKVIDDTVFGFFRYEIYKILKNESVVEYLKVVKDYAEACGTVSPFVELEYLSL